MVDLFFVGFLAVALAVLFIWAFRKLPGERWQFVGSIPIQKNGDGTWRGINLTYYGFFNASAYLLAVTTVFVLLGAAGVAVKVIFVYTFGLLGLCMPASRLVARLVEKKRYTFSIAGASFVGLLISPWLAWLMEESFGVYLPVRAAMGALSVSYALGEGVGRLACISFGCCYGKPISVLPKPLRRIFLGRSFIFLGKTKKIAYAGRLDGQAVLPIQAMTAVFYTAVGLIGMVFFLRGNLQSAFLLPLFATQLWRFVSEFLRADYRGRGRITAYQKMCLAAVVYAVIVVGTLTPTPPAGLPDLQAGLAGLWNPALLLFFQTLWVFSFLYTGKSQVTEAHMTFRVIQERI
jgi:hypothetical protein